MEMEIGRLKNENRETRRKAILKLLKTKIDNYIPSIVFLTDFQTDKFLENCLDKFKHKSYSFTINYKKQYELVPFILFLTKKQIKENQKARRKRTKYTITFSGDHFKKTCRQTLDLNQKLDYILNYKLLSTSQKMDLYNNLYYLNWDLFNADKKEKKKN